jgi:hypothetical protein
VRRAAVVLVVVVPAALLTAVVVDAGAGRTASPPPPGPGGPQMAQADVTRKAGPAAQPTASHRGKRLRATDDATPPSLGTAPAMSGSSPSSAAQDGVRQTAGVAHAARGPPALS